VCLLLTKTANRKLAQLATTFSTSGEISPSRSLRRFERNRPLFVHDPAAAQ